MLDQEEIEKNWEVFCTLVEEKSGQPEELGALLEHFAERLAGAPAGIRGYPGGLIEQNLKCLKVCFALNKKFQLGLSESSMVIVNLFRNVGLLGTLDEDLLIAAPEWQQKKGTHYQYNNDLTFMHPHDRSIFILQRFGVKLTEDEMIAILASGGKNDDYKFGDPPLSFATYAALRIVGFKDENND